MNSRYCIDLNDWDLTYSQLVEWSKVSRIDVWGINLRGANKPLTTYYFEDPEHLSAFKLKFAKIKGKTTPDFFK